MQIRIANTFVLENICIYAQNNYIHTHAYAHTYTRYIHRYSYMHVYPPVIHRLSNHPSTFLRPSAHLPDAGGGLQELGERRSSHRMLRSFSLPPSLPQDLQTVPANGWFPREPAPPALESALTNPRSKVQGQGDGEGGTTEGGAGAAGRRGRCGPF